MKFSASIFACACALLARVTQAFVPLSAPRPSVPSSITRHTSTSPVTSRPNAFPSTSAPVPARYVGGRRSETALAGMFGLGAPEIAVCLVVAAVVLGPDKLAGMAKDVGKMAGELKDVPAEFQAGIAEGERRANETKKLESSEAEVAKKDEAKEAA